MNEEIKAQWLTALRSGEYRQGTGSLSSRDEDGRPLFCCLGVLCDLHRTATGGAWESNKYLGECETLPFEVAEWAEFADDTSPENPCVGAYHLAEYNDGTIDDTLAPHTFFDIADLIEAHL